MVLYALALGLLMVLTVPVQLVSSSGRQLHDLAATNSDGLDAYHLTCEVFGPNAIGSPSNLYNPNFTGFQSLLDHVLNWGDTYLQTSWCGSGGFVATILAPSNKALKTGFKELNKRYGMHANPLDYVNNDPWVIGNSSPMVLGIDAIVEAGMIPHMAIDLDNDGRIPTVKVRSGETSHHYFQVHSSIANVNAKQMLRLWRNAADKRVYVFLPGGLLPGPYRVTTKTVRHVTNCKTCTPTNNVYVYEVEGLLVPNTVALGLLYVPAPIQVRGLSPFLRKIGPNGYTVSVGPETYFSGPTAGK